MSIFPVTISERAVTRTARPIIPLPQTVGERYAVGDAVQSESCGYEGLAHAGTCAEHRAALWREALHADCCEFLTDPAGEDGNHLLRRVAWLTG